MKYNYSISTDTMERRITYSGHVRTIEIKGLPGEIIDFNKTYCNPDMCKAYRPGGIYLSLGGSSIRCTPLKKNVTKCSEIFKHKEDSGVA